MKAAPLQDSFAGGEFSPLLQGRVSADRYKESVDTCLNYIPTVQGPVTRRPGTYYVAEVKDSSKDTRLVSFEFSTTQAYVLEFGDLYIRFYKDNAQIISGTPVEVVSPYVEADLYELKFTQSADVLYITHPSYAPRKLTRTSHTSWTLTTITFLDGPYLPINTTTTTITPSGTTGAITLTASAATFASTDVGRLVRIKHGSTWGYATITSFTSTTVVNATVNSAFGATTAATTWRLGVWSVTTGYPACVTFHEDRLFFAGSPNVPQRLDGSKSGDYENFAPTDTAGTVASDNALAFNLNANDVNVIRWMTSDEKGLLVGTVGGEWSVRASSQSEALTPTNVSAKRATSFGSADIQPIQSGKATIYVQRDLRKVRELTYFYDVDGFRAPDITVLAEHITKTGLVQLAYMKSPQAIIWGVRYDGVLIGLTYERESDNLRAGWHRHIVGGVSDAAGNEAIVESVAVIPAPEGDRDELWMTVRRRVDGATVRYVEYMTKFFETEDFQEDAFFVDSGLTYDDPKTVTAITAANPPVVTSAGHGFSNGDYVRISYAEGMTEVNGNTYKIANVAANTFELQTISGVNVDGTGYGAYLGSGEVRKLVTTISGLSHLEGQTVSVLADGAVLPDTTVSGGSITLPLRSSVVAVGLGYNSDLKLLRFDAGSQDGTSLGKTRRTHRVGMQLYRTLGLKLGMSFDSLDTITFRTSSDPMTRAPSLYTGIRSETVSADYDFENQICIRQDQPLPGTILAIMPQMVTQDR